MIKVCFGAAKMEMLPQDKYINRLVKNIGLTVTNVHIHSFPYCQIYLVDSGVHIVQTHQNIYAIVQLVNIVWKNRSHLMIKVSIGARKMEILHQDKYSEHLIQSFGLIVIHVLIRLKLY
jgi:hypothetical protein